MNIRLRLTLWYTAILFLILAVFSGLVYIGLSRSLIAIVDNQLRREAGQIIASLNIEHSDDNEEEEHGEDYERRVAGYKIELRYTPEDGVFWRILDTSGQPVFDPGHFAGVPLETAHIVNGQPRFAYAVLADDTPIRLYTRPFTFRTQETGLLQVAESYQYIVEVQEQLIFLLAISLPFVLLVASGGGWFLASRALTPIDHITRSAQRISADDLHQRLNLQLPNDEVGRLAATFDQMLGRLEAAFDRQKRFIADASHEIRTPLTILKGDVEVALYRPRSIPEYQETLVMVNQTADRLNALVEELLLLARADNNQYPLQIKSIDLATLLQQEVAHLQSKATSKNITLTLETPATLPMLADPAKLSRLFINLIDNALKYSDPGSQVRVTASPKNQQIRVTIADTGPGIPAAHLPHLFDRFYRVDQARARQEANTTVSSGAGLGLSIAQWLAQIHGGRIEVASKVGTGTTFTVWLPLEPPQA